VVFVSACFGPSVSPVHEQNNSHHTELGSTQSSNFRKGWKSY